MRVHMDAACSKDSASSTITVQIYAHDALSRCSRSQAAGSATAHDQNTMPMSASVLLHTLTVATRMATQIHCDTSELHTNVAHNGQIFVTEACVQKFVDVC